MQCMNEGIQDSAERLVNVVALADSVVARVPRWRVSNMKLSRFRFITHYDKP